MASKWPQAHVRWAAFLNPDDHELIVLATTVIKRRGIFSAKRRQLVLTEGTEGCSRIFYVDPTNLELKGSIPWSSDLHAEASIKGHFRIHTPGRTYYLEDVAGDQATAELWVQTISNIQARLLQQRINGGGSVSPRSPVTARRLPEI